MPGFKMPTIKISGFREMSTDDIKSALSDVRVPSVKASDLDPRRMDLPKVDLSKIDLSKLDIDLSGITTAVSEAASSVAERTPLRRKRRSRLRFVITGLIVAAIGYLVVRNAQWLRTRAADAAQRIRERTEAERVNQSLEPLGSDNGLYADTDVAIPIEADAFADTLPSAEPELPTASEELAHTMGSESRVGVYGERLTDEDRLPPA